MKQVLIHKGNAILTEVPAPSIEAGEVLVQVRASCLSVGTEMSGVRSSAIPLWKKVLQQPEKIISTIELAKTIGFNRTWSLIEEKRDASFPTGYSASGEVIAIGNNIIDILPGDRVACAGNQYAFHSEFIRVPRNLCTLIPEDVNYEEASTVTLGAIALQGVRRAKPTLGECFVIIGLGLIGQLTVQLLHANGCRTIGIDLDKERISCAKKSGMDIGIIAGNINDYTEVARITDGFGADGVIITAASPSDDIVSNAFKICRKKGRVVLVGDVGLKLNRSDFYSKEIDFLISSSYGPGRYDNRYEEQGLDYPLAYVRWTENRNMSEFLKQIAEKRVLIEPLITCKYPIEEAPKAFASLNSSDNKPMMVLLTYPDSKDSPKKYVVYKTNSNSAEGPIRIAIVGAGNFARSTHLPNIKNLSKQFELHAIVTRTGHTAAAIAKQFGAAYATTDYSKVLIDPNIDAVVIATRHHLHGSMALAALQAGKHVFVEKPLALSIEDVKALDTYISLVGDKPLPVLLTGYNRRFSPFAHRIAGIIKSRSGPFIINYRMNAGYIPLDHWIHSAEGGGRNLGEACHIYDLFTFFCDAEVTKISAHAIKPKGHYYARNDNFVVTLSYADGSVATLTYTAMGAKEIPKEMADIYVDGRILVMNDYRRLEIHGSKGGVFKTSIQEKGLKEELIAFADAIKGGEWPIPWWQQKQTMDIAFAVEKAISGFNI